VLAQQAAALEEQQHYTVLSPADGTITLVDVVAGQSVESGRPLTTLLPSASAMIVEALLPSASASFVTPGQRVRIRYDALPSGRYGSFPGIVRQVSGVSQATDDLGRSSGANGLVFKIWVDPREEVIYSSSREVRLKPGMSLSVLITNDHRSLLDVLTEAILPVDF